MLVTECSRLPPRRICDGEGREARPVCILSVSQLRVETRRVSDRDILCSILHFAFMLTLGFLGFAMKSNAAAGWAMAVLINLAVSTQSFGEWERVSQRYTLAQC